MLRQQKNTIRIQLKSENPCKNSYQRNRVQMPKIVLTSPKDKWTSINSANLQGRIRAIEKKLKVRGGVKIQYPDVTFFVSKE
jgi:hypothetical protein